MDRSTLIRAVKLKVPQEKEYLNFLTPQDNFISRHKLAKTEKDLAGLALITGDVQFRPTIVMHICNFNQHIDHRESQLKATGGATKTAVLICETVTQTMNFIDYRGGRYAGIFYIYVTTFKILLQMERHTKY